MLNLIKEKMSSKDALAAAPPSGIDYSKDPNYSGYIVSQIREQLEQLERDFVEIKDRTNRKDLLKDSQIWTRLESINELCSEFLDYDLSEEEIGKVDEIIRKITRSRELKERMDDPGTGLSKTLKEIMDEALENDKKWHLNSFQGKVIEFIRTRVNSIREDIPKSES